VAPVHVDIAREVADALTMRTASIAVDEVRASAQGVSIESRRMRMGYAMAFGEYREEAEQERVRPDAVRVAFNSPFRPFVLATTSIGQEGLDFHQYCHAVVHWNLPANPVDLEQREGRVHRYKCHAVRRNLAATYGAKVSGLDATDPWEAIFNLASAEAPEIHGGMVPFWVFDPPDGCAIERHVPMLPLSRDEQRYEDLRRSLAVYRMVFGQPRQEDLVAYLIERVSPEKLDEVRENLICLAPRQQTRRPG